MATSLPDTLVGSLGSEGVASQDHLSHYSVDGVVPEAAVLPSGIDAVSQVLAFASDAGKVVVPRGGGTQMALGNTPPRVDLVMGLTRLNRLLFHEPGDLVAGVEAGISLNTLQAELALQGQFLPMEGPLPDRATIGGILAANATGPSRFTYGSPRDWLIGIKVVHSDGAVTKSGGRVVKNVTGYDLNKLYTGSLGTLGIIVEATFKLAPAPAERVTLVATYPSTNTALAAAGGLLRQSATPQALQVIDRRVTGRLPGLVPGVNQATVLALLSGRRVAVKRRADDCATALDRGGARTVGTLSSKDGDRLWQAITDLGWTEEMPPSLVAKVGILPSQVGEFLEVASQLDRPGVVADVGSGLVRLLWWPDDAVANTEEDLERIIHRLRDVVYSINGHVVIERCPVHIKSNLDVWGDPPEAIDVMRRVKGQLDPAGILNAGRFAGGI